MSAVLLLSAALAAVSVLLALGPGWPRGARLDRAGAGWTRAGPPGRADPTAPAALAWSRPAGAAAGLAVWLLVGGWVGAVGGAATVAVVPLVVGRLEPASARRERLELQRSAPVIADLLAAALAAGVPLGQAVAVVAHALGGTPGRVLGEVSRLVELGADPTAAWAHVSTRPGLSGIARAVARAARTGAPMADLLAAEAAELRARATAAGLAEIRAASVRAVLPLGLCLLPAFGLLGIVPVVAGLVAGL